MKYLLTLLALCCALSTYAQKYEYKGIKNFPVSEETGKITYEGVVEVEGKTAQQLYSAAKEWIAKNYRDGKEVVQMDQPGEKILGKGAVKADGSVITFNFSLQFKDGRYRYELTDFIDHYTVSGRSVDKAMEEGIAVEPKVNRKYLDDSYAKTNRLLEKAAQQFHAIAPSQEKKDW